MKDQLFDCAVVRGVKKKKKTLIIGRLFLYPSERDGLLRLGSADGDDMFGAFFWGGISSPVGFVSRLHEGIFKTAHTVT